MRAAYKAVLVIRRKPFPLSSPQSRPKHKPLSFKRSNPNRSLSGIAKLTKPSKAANPSQPVMLLRLIRYRVCSFSSPMNTQRASSSSTRRWRYDVILSFCGNDTRKGFSDHLYAAFKRKGISIFRDSENLGRGKNISQELLKAIRESKYAVVVISENFAFSKWCLIELTKMVECRKKRKLTILPVFYHVDPSDVRNKVASFAKAFTRHIEDPNIEEEKRKTWEVALKEVGGLSGWHVHDSDESKVAEAICDTIVPGLRHT